MELEEDEPTSGRKPRPGIYLLPNLLTTGALFAGFYAIVAAMNGRFVAAAEAVFIAGLLDGLDGRVARLTNTQSDFGVQYDSLSDLISFGLAPALVMYLWSLGALAEHSQIAGKIGWLAAFLFAACAALRLARFNTQAEVADKRYFQGLASPAAAAGMITPVWVLASEGLDGADFSFIMVPISVGLALLMVSNIRYVSFKGWPNRDRVPFLWILAILGIFVLLAIDPPLVLLCIAYTYAVSGPLMTVLGRRSRLNLRRGRKQEDPE